MKFYTTALTATAALFSGTASAAGEKVSQDVHKPKLLYVPILF
jgi:hypothetical protein